MRFIARYKKQIAAVFLILFIVLYNTTALADAFSFARKPMLFMGSILYTAGKPINNFFTALFKANSLSFQIASQQEAIADLNFKLNELGAGSEESEQSFEQLSNLFGATIIKTRVISSHLSAGKRIVILNKGESDGIKEGYAVITDHAVFVGKVIQAKKDFSAVLVVTDSSSAVASSLASNNNVQAIVRVKQGIGLEMDLIPQDAVIDQEYVVVTSLLEENTPQGLLIGTVASVKYTEGELFKRASLSPFFSIHNLSNVGVIIPNNIE
ncbi:MAG: hypothetical protein COY02_02570 [Parcubacteria group bacterium CG_4_10_14_0_2_um_filter_41_6]|nr:MAG: hypothetical protein COY02_02570 [Parcubacteria group bacterium CG_4_10_14_0_2_um_filter_41_6]